MLLESLVPQLVCRASEGRNGEEIGFSDLNVFHLDIAVCVEKSKVKC